MPDTLDYMIYGYAIAYFILTSLIISIWWRYHNLAKTKIQLEQLEADIKKDS